MVFRIKNKTKSDHHATPDEVFNYIKIEHEIDLRKMFDPCPLHSNFDGLKANWKKENYINPPYELIEEFLEKSFAEWQKNKKCYILYPMSKSDKPYFHEYLVGFPMIFFPFRIKFVGAKDPSQQTHALVCME